MCSLTSAILGRFQDHKKLHMDHNSFKLNVTRKKLSPASGFTAGEMPVSLRLKQFFYLRHAILGILGIGICTNSSGPAARDRGTADHGLEPIPQTC